jgi:putative transposase
LTYSTKENHATHQLFSVRAMCRCLRIHPSGFYAWLKDPLSERDREDARQTELIRKAWKDSGKVYGYRKLHDDLLDQGETCCPNRVARLARIAGIKAQVGSQTWQRADRLRNTKVGRLV